MAPTVYQVIGKKLKEEDGKLPAKKVLALGETIRQLREKAGLSGAELCRRSAKMDPRTLTAIEKGRIRNPSLENLQKIAQGLGCLVGDLFIRSEMSSYRNFRLGSSKGEFVMEFPKQGFKVVSSTPPIPEFFCGKLILSPLKKMTGELLHRPAPVFLEVAIGRFEVKIESEAFSLKEGETLFFNGSLRHSFQNPLNRESALWLVTAPSFFHG